MEIGFDDLFAKDDDETGVVSIDWKDQDADIVEAVGWRLGRRDWNMDHDGDEAVIRLAGKCVHVQTGRMARAHADLTF